MKKKNIFLGVALASLSLGLAACSSKKEPTPEPTPPVDVVSDVKVMFDTQGGSGIAYQIIEKNAKVTKPADPTKEGYDFAGWYKEKACINEFDFNQSITENIVLYAKWTEKAVEVEHVSVTFDTQGGTSIDTIEINKGSTLTKPADPTKEGYEFVGWKLNGEEFNFETTVENDITLIAVWKQAGSDTPDPVKYTVTFDTDGGTEINAVTVSENETLTKPTDPTKTGYSFDKWLLNGEEFNFETPINSNITLTASYIINKYMVSFDTQGGTSVDSVEVEYNGKVTKPADPTKEGYTFVGWLYKGEAFDFENYQVTDTVTIIASWKKEGSDTPDPIKYTVTFNTDGGSTLDSALVDYNTAVSKPADPTKEGYTFVGWYLDDEAYDFTKLVFKDIELKAKWEINKYTVTFDTKCDLTLDPIETNYNTTIIKPTDLVREGYTFNGWLLNGEAFDFETAIIADITLEASWTEIEIESITISDEDFTIYVDSFKQLTATINPSTVAASKKTITWTSSDESIATVDENGKVVGVSTGHVTITATTTNGLSDTCTIHVATYLINEDFNDMELDTKLEQWDGSWDGSSSIFGTNNSKTNYETHYPIIKGDENDKKVELIDTNGGTAEVAITYGAHLMGSFYGSFDLEMIEVGGSWTFVQFYGSSKTNYGEVFGLRAYEEKVDDQKSLYILYRIDGKTEKKLASPLKLEDGQTYHIYYEFVWNDTRQAYDVKIEINNTPYITYESEIVNLDGVKLVSADGKSYRFTVDNVKLGYIDLTLDQYKLFAKASVDELVNSFNSEDYTEENWNLIQTKRTALFTSIDEFTGETQAFIEMISYAYDELYEIETIKATELRLYKEDALNRVIEIENANKDNYTIVKNDENDIYANKEAFDKFILDMKKDIDYAYSKENVDEILAREINIKTNEEIIEFLITNLKGEISDYQPSTENGETYEYNLTVIVGYKNDFMTFTETSHTKEELLNKVIEVKALIDSVKDDATYLEEKKTEAKEAINTNLTDAITAIEAIDESHANIQSLRDLASAKEELIDNASTLEEIKNILSDWNTEYVQLKEEALLTPEDAKPIYKEYLTNKKTEVEGIYNAESDAELLANINSIITTADENIDSATTVKDIVKLYNDAIKAIDDAIALDTLNKAKQVAKDSLDSLVTELNIDSSLNDMINEIVTDYKTNIDGCNNQVEIDTTKQTASDIIGSIVNLFNYATTIKAQIESNEIKENVDTEVATHINLIKSSTSSAEAESNYQTAKAAIDEINDNKTQHWFDVSYTIANTTISGTLSVRYGQKVDLTTIKVTAMQAVSITKDNVALGEIYDDVTEAVVTIEALENAVFNEVWSSQDKTTPEVKTTTVIENDLFTFETHNNGWEYALTYFQSANIGKIDSGIINSEEQNIYVSSDLSSLKFRIAVADSKLSSTRKYKMYFYVNGKEITEKTIDETSSGSKDFKNIEFNNLPSGSIITIKVSDLSSGSRIYLSDMSAELDVNSIPKTVSVKYGDETKYFSHLENIELEPTADYNFKSWYYLNEDEKVYLDGKTLPANTSITAFAETYPENVTIKFMNGEVQHAEKHYSVWENHTYVDYSDVEEPVHGTSGFVCWVTEENGSTEFDFSNVSPSDEPYVVYAKFAEAHSITVDLGGITITGYKNGDEQIEAATITISDKAVLSLDDLPTEVYAEGYRFEGWYSDVEKQNKITSEIALTEDITIYANFIQQFTVSFETNCESKINNLIVDKDSLISKPEDPTKEGYGFKGWYKEAECNNEWNFETDKVTANTILYASWSDQITDSFELKEMAKNTDYTSVSGYFKLKTDKKISLVSPGIQNDGNGGTLTITAVNKIVVEIVLSAGDSKGLDNKAGTYTLTGSGKYFDGSEFVAIDSLDISTSKNNTITVIIEIEAGNSVALKCTNRIGIHSITATVTL